MTRYHPALVTLHWVLAALIIISLVMGRAVLKDMPNADPEKVQVLIGHMIFGTLILLLMLVRIVVRFASEKPPAADAGSAILNFAGRWAHRAFYVIVIALCASGIATAVFADLPAILFGPADKSLPESFDNIPPLKAHGLLSTVLIVLILGHVLAALHHQFYLRDSLLRRMTFGPRQSPDKQTEG